MKRLLTLTDEDVFTNRNNLPTSDFWKREASRAVVISKNNEIYLLKLSTYGYHKLPGGGIDAGETIEDAVHRELLEEIGCVARLEKELGEIQEYRNNDKLDQISYCYIAKQTAPLVPTSLEESEIEEGAETVIAKNIDEAIKLLQDDKPLHYEGHFIRFRDLRFLQEAKNLL